VYSPIRGRGSTSNKNIYDLIYGRPRFIKLILQEKLKLILGKGSLGSAEDIVASLQEVFNSGTLSKSALAKTLLVQKVTYTKAQLTHFGTNLLKLKLY